LIEKSHIVDEIKRTAAANDGQPLGIARFEQETGINRNDWYGKHWVTWGDALTEAGFAPNTLQGAYDDDYVLAQLVALIRELGHYPVAGELRMRARNDPAFPSHNVFNRVGRKSELAEKIISAYEHRDGFEDVVDICRNIAADQVSPEPDSTANDDVELGYVYLIKSGRYYKIGHTTSVGRREYELAIQMPEKLDTVHVIKTDDPPGIEAYWHRRFDKKRKNGEWFALDAADVRAFKRRKFM